MIADLSGWLTGGFWDLEWRPRADDRLFSPIGSLLDGLEKSRTWREWWTGQADVPLELLWGIEPEITRVLSQRRSQNYITVTTRLSGTDIYALADEDIEPRAKREVARAIDYVVHRRGLNPPPGLPWGR